MRSGSSCGERLYHDLAMAESYPRAHVATRVRATNALRVLSLRYQNAARRALRHVLGNQPNNPGDLISDA